MQGHGSRLGGLGRGHARVWDDNIDTVRDQEHALSEGQDDLADDLEAERRDSDWRRRVLTEGLR